MVETLQELHCRIRPGILREFNIKLLDLMSETRRKERTGTNETHPIVCPQEQRCVLKFKESNASLDSVTLRPQTALR